MASSVINRQTVREALATKITNGINDTTNWQVFPFSTVSFEKARNIVVAGSDSDYPQEGAGAEEKASSDFSFDFRIIVFILYEDNSLSWTAQNSEDALDLGRKKVTDIIRDNRVNAGVWSRLGFNGRSAVGLVDDIGGTPYRYEVIPVRAVFDEA